MCSLQHEVQAAPHFRRCFIENCIDFSGYDGGRTRWAISVFGSTLKPEHETQHPRFLRDP